MRKIFHAFGDQRLSKGPRGCVNLGVVIGSHKGGLKKAALQGSREYGNFHGIWILLAYLKPLLTGNQNLISTSMPA